MICLINALIKKGIFFLVEVPMNNERQRWSLNYEFEILIEVMLGANAFISRCSPSNLSINGFQLLIIIKD